jgi:hypothetical protein
VSLCIFGRYAPFEATILSIAFANINVPIQTEDDEEEEEALMPPEDDENSNEAPGYAPLHPDDDEDGIDIILT